MRPMAVHYTLMTRNAIEKFDAAQRSSSNRRHVASGGVGVARLGATDIPSTKATD